MSSGAQNAAGAPSLVPPGPDSCPRARLALSGARGECWHGGSSLTSHLVFAAGRHGCQDQVGTCTKVLTEYLVGRKRAVDVLCCPGLEPEPHGVTASRTVRATPTNPWGSPGPGVPRSIGSVGLNCRGSCTPANLTEAKFIQQTINPGLVLYRNGTRGLHTSWASDSTLLKRGKRAILGILLMAAEESWGQGWPGRLSSKDPRSPFRACAPSADPCANVCPSLAPRPRAQLSV